MGSSKTHIYFYNLIVCTNSNEWRLFFFLFFYFQLFFHSCGFYSTQSKKSQLVGCGWCVWEIYGRISNRLKKESYFITTSSVCHERKRSNQFKRSAKLLPNINWLCVRACMCWLLFCTFVNIHQIEIETVNYDYALIEKYPALCVWISVGVQFVFSIFFAFFTPFHFPCEWIQL